MWVMVPLCSGAGAAQARMGREGDTLELPQKSVYRDTSADAAPVKTELVPTDEDRLTGNLGDLLQRMSGAHVVRTGGIGDYLGVSLWGGSEQQVNIYVNGVLQNRAVDPAQFLSEWDLSRVEKIEVYKGLVPDNLAGAPMGGALNIITRESLPGVGTQAAVGAGSFGSWKGEGGWNYRGESSRAHVQAVRDQSDGDFSYYDDNGAEFQTGRNPDGVGRLGPDDLIRKTRRNNAAEFSLLDGSYSIVPPSIPGLEIGAQSELSWLHKQVPSPYANVDSTINFSTFREAMKSSGHAFGRWEQNNRSLSLDLSGALNNERYVDTGDVRSRIGPAPNRDRNTYLDLQASLSGMQRISEGFTVSGFCNYGLSGFLYQDQAAAKTYPWLVRYTGEGKISPAYRTGHHAFQGAVSALLDVQEYDGIAYALGGQRLPNEVWGRHWAAQGGYQYKPRAAWSLSAQLGSAYRIPTFLEKFGDRGTVSGNPGLRDEEGVKASLGLHAESSRWELDAQVFGSEGRRIITLIQVTDNVLKYSNTGATRVIGAETDLAWKPKTWNRTDLGLTLEKALAVNGDAANAEYKLIPYRPQSQASLRESFFKGGWTLAATGYYQGLAFPSAANYPSIFDSYSHNTEWQSRVDLSLSWRRRHFLATGGMNNAFDQRNFDFFNYPLPGRSFAAALQWTL